MKDPQCPAALVRASLGRGEWRQLSVQAGCFAVEPAAARRAHRGTPSGGATADIAAAAWDSWECGRAPSTPQPQPRVMGA